MIGILQNKMHEIVLINLYTVVWEIFNSKNVSWVQLATKSVIWKFIITINSEIWCNIMTKLSWNISWTMVVNIHWSWYKIKHRPMTLLNTQIYSSSNILILLHINTWKLIVSFVAKQFRHRRSENPTPTLNPPSEWAACVSAKTARTAPLTNIIYS